MNELSAEELLGIIDSFVTKLQPLYFLQDGVYFLSKNKQLADKILIILDDEPEFLFLTGPLPIRRFSRLIFRILGLKKYLELYTRKLNEQIKVKIRAKVSMKTITYLDFARSFVDMLIKYFGVAPNELANYVLVDSETLDSLVEVRTLLIDEHAKAKMFLEKWNPKKFLVPRENTIRLLDDNGYFEVKAYPIDDEKLRVFMRTKKKILDRTRLNRVFLVGAYWELERRKLIYIDAAMSVIDNILKSKQNIVVALAQKLEEEKRIEVPVDLGGIKTRVGLRIVNDVVYAFINTGEYIVKEVVNPRYRTGPDVYIYFPPIDVCVELRQEKLRNRTIIYPAEAPVLVDAFLHPSVKTPYGIRTVCLGDKNYYVMRLINAAKELASGSEKVMISDLGLIITSPEQVLAEILKTSFWVMRYGYKRGAKPHKYATDCAGRFGVKLITNKQELESYKRRGVEVVGEEN